jgi:N-acyl-L-homoserine lactone synthetase
MERLMRRTGVRIHRFGPPQRIGNMLAMAGWADVTRENLNLSANAAGSTGDLRLAS